MGEIINACKIVVAKSKERAHLRDLGVSGGKYNSGS
jgi:hypothetical protein